MNICKAAGTRRYRTVNMSSVAVRGDARANHHLNWEHPGNGQRPDGRTGGGARVMIRNRGTGQTSEITTNSSGTYASGALTPGNYVVQVEATGFSSVQMQITVQVNVTSGGNIRLSVGQSSQVVEVQGSEVAVNTEQATVQGVLTSQQIESLPINRVPRVGAGGRFAQHCHAVFSPHQTLPPYAETNCQIHKPR